MGGLSLKGNPVSPHLQGSRPTAVMMSAHPTPACSQSQPSSASCPSYWLRMSTERCASRAAAAGQRTPHEEQNLNTSRSLQRAAGVLQVNTEQSKAAEKGHISPILNQEEQEHTPTQLHPGCTQTQDFMCPRRFAFHKLASSKA